MLKQIISSIREYKKDTILTPIYVTIEVLLEVMIPLLMAFLIDYGINKGDTSYILKIGITLLVLTIIALVFGILSAQSAAKASAGFAKNLRHDLFTKVQEFSFSNVDKFSTAGIITRLTTDVTNIQNAYQVIIRIAIKCPLMLIFSLYMAFTINTELSYIFLAMIILLGLGLTIIVKKAHPLFEGVFRIYDRLNNTVQENLRGIRVVKSFVREEDEIHKFKDVSKVIYHNFSKAEKIVAFNTPLMQFCVYGCMLLISWISAQLIVSNSMTTGQLISLISYAMQILMSLMMLSMILVMITIAQTSTERVNEILSEKLDQQVIDHPITDVKNGSIEFKDVSFRYGHESNKYSLKHINLTIKEGETIGILGSTGSAKTTLVQLIPRLYDVSEGALFVGGINVLDYDITHLRNAVAMVLQKNELFFGSIRDNLRWGNENACDEELKRACELAQASEFIEEFTDGYDTQIEQGGSNLSGGQKQRICIARALLKKPKILILDDSTSAVDTKNDALIRSALRTELPNTTKLIITQRISSIIDADKILVLDRGEVNGIGTHEQLIATNQIYQEIEQSQMKGDNDLEIK